MQKETYERIPKKAKPEPGDTIMFYYPFSGTEPVNDLIVQEIWEGMHMGISIMMARATKQGELLINACIPHNGKVQFFYANSYDLDYCSVVKKANGKK